MCTVRQDHIGMIVRPIGRSRNRLLVRQKERLDAPDHFVHVATNTGGVIERQHELIFWINDKHRTDRQGQTLLVRRAGINHTIGRRNGPVGVTDNRELDLDLIVTMRDHILEPFRVGSDRIDGQRGNLTTKFGQFVILECETTNFGRTDGGKVSGVGKEDLLSTVIYECGRLVSLVEIVRRAEDFILGTGDGRTSDICTYRPLSLLPLVEGFPLALGRFGGKVGNDVAQTKA